MQRHRSLTLIAILFEGGLAVAAVAVGWIIGFSPLERLRLDGANWWQMLLLGFAAAVPMFVGLALIQVLPMPAFARLRDVAERLLFQLLHRCTIAELAVISLCAGFGEEVLFRGLLQEGLAAWIGAPQGIWIALCLASLAFGFAHAITRTYVVLAALAGAYLGWLLMVTDNLFVPIVAHAVYDFGAILFILRGTRQDRTPLPKSEPTDTSQSDSEL